jgi:ribonuclease HI
MDISSPTTPDTVVHIYAAASPSNPYVHGGIAAVTIRTNKDGDMIKRAIRSCYLRGETQPRLEMLAAISAIEALGSRTDELIVVYTKSDLIPKAMTEWLPKWKAQGWTRTHRRPVENPDLWERLEAAAKGRCIEWRVVKEALFQGHHVEAANEALRCAKEGMFQGA